MKRDYTIATPRALPVPWCDRCGKHCESLEEYEDVLRERLVLTAVCHGERERVTIDTHELRDSAINISGGVAFRQAKLLVP